MLTGIALSFVAVSSDTSLTQAAAPQPQSYVSPVQAPAPSQKWKMWIDLRASPAIGEDVRISSDTDRVDDSDYEATLRIRHDIDRLRGLRIEARAGVVALPNTFDNEDAESSIYGEVQLGDTFLTFADIRRLRLGQSASATARKAARPYVRYRFSRNYGGFVTDYKRTDHRFTAGLRYRYVPWTVVWTPTEGGQPSQPVTLPRTYFEARGELTRVDSTAPSQEHWNPRVQVDFYSRPFWNATRFVVKATGDLFRFDNLRTQGGERILDKRLRLSAGFDVSEPIKDWMDLTDTSLQLEITGRWQRRWSNQPTREHSRAYFVPQLSLQIPVQ